MRLLPSPRLATAAVLTLASLVTACEVAPDERRTQGQVLGGVAGAALGATVGAGSGQLVAVGAGAVTPDRAQIDRRQAAGTVR